MPEMHRNAIFPLVNMEVKAFEQKLSLQKDGDSCKNTRYVILLAQLHNIKLNKILQPNILVYFNTIFNVKQRTMIVR